MRIIVIECGSDLTVRLQAAGFTVSRFAHNEVTSLTALLLDQTGICGMVIQDQAAQIWSAAHFLTAAKQLSRAGHTVLYGYGKLAEQCCNSPLVTICAEIEQVVQMLLQQPAKKAGAGNGRPGIPFRYHTEEDKEPQKEKEPARIQPLNIPRDKLLFVAVVGSQTRIGCTTQAIGLWHYFKALGFDPAIASGAGQIAQIGGAMRGEQIDGGQKIEGIPFVTDTALAYDCYILDVGIDGNLEEIKKAVDCTILVAGSKPWELQNTAAAARAIRGSDHKILLSFTTKGSAEKLLPVFGGEAAMAAPWIPDMWKPDMPSLLVYDQLLRSMIAKVLEIPTPQPEPFH